MGWGNCNGASKARLSTAFRQPAPVPSGHLAWSVFEIITEQDITFDSGNLTLEGIVHVPEGPGKFPGVVVCHPHPRYGGDMRNGIVVALSQCLRDAGIAALRFNFRGAGNSEGTFDRGIGEVQDVAEAVTYLTLHDAVESSRVGVAGYSFGAWMALAACEASSMVQAVVSIACPAGPFRELGVGQMLQPKLIICGDLDHDFPVEQFKFLARRFSEPKEVQLIDGADHFFGGREVELAEMATAFFARRLGDGSG